MRIIFFYEKSTATSHDMKAFVDIKVCKEADRIIEICRNSAVPWKIMWHKDMHSVMCFP